MQNLNHVDYTVIGVYFCILVGLGLYLKRKASASLEDYFLGGRRLPWWALGVSGMASFLDITGTMIIVSFLFMLGPRGLFVEFRGGVVLVLAIYMLWSGKWHRRSGCITGAEWMEFRFGNGFGAHFARIMRAVAEVIFTVGMLAYLVKGVGLFLSMFLPWTPLQCSLVMIGVATVYTMVSGFYGVVFTDMFQSLIILIAVVSISVIAMTAVAAHGDMADLAATVTGQSRWMESAPPWKTSMPKGYEGYSFLSLMAFMYLLRNVFYGMAQGDDPKYFGAKSDRDCGRLTFLWTWLMMFRWPMMMGFAVLGIFMVHQWFPDRGMLAQATDLIKQHTAVTDQARWADVLASVMNQPQQYAPTLVDGLRELFGPEWQTKLHLVGFHGTVNPERILPAVILHRVPMGLRGMLLVALIAASMSTFDSTVNKTAGFFTRDLYQRYLRPKASNRELIYASWGFCAAVVALGFIMGYKARNINDIWGWIIMGLGGGMLVPLFLRLYWWRFNGGGFAFGMTVGLIGAVVQRIAFPDLGELQQFGIMLAIGLLASIVGTFLTPPTSPEVLQRFYIQTRPFGLWRPLKKNLPHDLRTAMEQEHRRDLLAVPFALGWQITLFMLPMQLIVQSYRAFGITLAIFVFCLAGLYLVWLGPQSEPSVAADIAQQQIRQRA
ncbi:MAG: sodium:solute symporter [Phycisphaerae bacterium]|nr:sodium:solute symporter [Phycisphaerae bacterium]